MIVFASGEGVTDIGNSNIAGPMRKLMDFKIKEKCNIEYEFEIISKRDLKNNKTLKLPSKKDKTLNLERGYFFKNTYCLSKIIKDKLKGKEIELLLVAFFRDSDTTKQKEWRKKYNSIIDGFKIGQCEQGVPMLPKTSSEVWLLSSILKSHKMENGKNLEEIGDRDYLKTELKKKINNEDINDYSFNFSNISSEILSYSQFECDLNSVLEARSTNSEATA
jgi:hypothetical protein